MRYVPVNVSLKLVGEFELEPVFALAPVNLTFPLWLNELMLPDLEKVAWLETVQTVLEVPLRVGFVTLEIES
jgi:hypothetical protein